MYHPHLFFPERSTASPDRTAALPSVLSGSSWLCPDLSHGWAVVSSIELDSPAAADGTVREGGAGVSDATHTMARMRRATCQALSAEEVSLGGAMGWKRAARGGSGVEQGWYASGPEVGLRHSADGSDPQIVCGAIKHSRDPDATRWRKGGSHRPSFLRPTESSTDWVCVGDCLVHCIPYPWVFVSAQSESKSYNLDRLTHCKALALSQPIILRSVPY